MTPVYAHENPCTSKQPSIFLAGPSPRGADDYNWRPQALDILERLEFAGDVYVPLPRNGEWLDNYDAQIDWELRYIESSRTVAFWIPRDLVHLPGFTTNVEFGLCVRMSKGVLGYPPEAEKMRYLHRVAQRFHMPIFHTLEETLSEAMRLAYREPRASA